MNYSYAGAVCTGGCALVSLAMGSKANYLAKQNLLLRGLFTLNGKYNEDEVEGLFKHMDLNHLNLIRNDGARTHDAVWEAWRKWLDEGGQPRINMVNRLVQARYGGGCRGGKDAASATMQPAPRIRHTTS